MHVVAHLSDPHLDGTARSRGRWSAVAAHVRGLPTPVDAIVVTGDLGHAEIDPVLLRQPDAFTRVIGDHPEVVAVLAGHAHGSIATTVAGRPLRVAPGIASELLLPWEVSHDGPPLFDLDAPPAVAYHVVHDDGRVTSHHRTVPLPATG